MRTTGFIILGLMLLTASLASAATPDDNALTAPADLASASLSRLTGLTGVNFTIAYMRFLYQQNADISAVASLGANRANDQYIRDLSKKIIKERSDMNSKLTALYPQAAGRGSLSSNPGAVRDTISYLAGYGGPDFDQRYAEVMVQLMGQAQAAADMAKTRATIPELRDQAKVVSRTNSNEANAFQRWLQTGFLTLQQENSYCAINWNDPRCPIIYRPRPFFGPYPFDGYYPYYPFYGPHFPHHEHEGIHFGIGIGA